MSDQFDLEHKHYQMRFPLKMLGEEDEWWRAFDRWIFLENFGSGK